MSRFETDVAIVGAGILGLAHAYIAAKAGKSVVVFRKEPARGGCFRAGLGHGVADWPACRGHAWSFLCAAANSGWKCSTRPSCLDAKLGRST